MNMTLKISEVKILHFWYRQIVMVLIKLNVNACLSCFPLVYRLKLVAAPKRELLVLWEMVLLVFVFPISSSFTWKEAG